MSASKIDARVARKGTRPQVLPKKVVEVRADGVMIMMIVMIISCKQEFVSLKKGKDDQRKTNTFFI